MSEASPFRRQPGHPDVVRHDWLSCYACGYLFDAASHHDGRATAGPGDGDWAVCFRCGAVARYVVGALGVALRAADADELAEFQSDPQHMALVRDLHGFWASRR